MLTRSHSRYTISRSDIRPGIVLWLDPDVLVEKGATYICAFAQRVQGVHLFLCLEVDATSGRWVPLYSKPCDGRVSIPRRGRRGHPAWVKGTSYYDSRQVWRAPHAAVAEAAVAAGDKSGPSRRNWIRADRVPAI